ncbi:MAG: bifunctional precorrin-2 dehydrogenase/sirohydrochlorin ferrochelatase [Candidatus Omnitrophota bacterium]
MSHGRRKTEDGRRNWYPVSLSIAGKRIVVIGGGTVAERKVKNCMPCGCVVTVVSPTLTGSLRRRLIKKEIRYVESAYNIRHLKGAILVYAATSDRNVNKRIARDAGKRRILVNVCDSKEESSFIVPAVFRKKGVTVAVSTGGRSPSKAARYRDRLKGCV